jgi:hypothetical protein
MKPRSRPAISRSEHICRSRSVGEILGESLNHLDVARHSEIIFASIPMTNASVNPARRQALPLSNEM